jgi:hypothetical protein
VNRRSELITSLLPAIFLFGTMAAAGQNFFPAGVFFPDNLKLDSFKARWYSEQLTVLDEPSLLFEAKQDSTAQSYRFLWLRSFHRPIAVRVLIHSDGSGMLITKMLDGSRAHKSGKLVINKTESLSPDRVKNLREEIDRLGFWTLQVRDPNTAGRDGAQWVIEGIDRGTYHLIDRRSPEKGPVRELGLYFIRELSGSYLKAEEIY